MDTVCALAPASQVTLSAFDEAAAGSLTLTAAGPLVLEDGSALTDRVEQLAATAWRDLSDDTLTVEWTWPHAEDDRQAADKGTRLFP